MIERRFDPIEGVWRHLRRPAPHRGSSFRGPEVCPLCPTMPGGAQTDIPRASFDIAVLAGPACGIEPVTPTEAPVGSALYAVAPALDASELVVYTDRHDATLAQLGVRKIEQLVHVWSDRLAALGSRTDVAYVLVFEDCGVPSESPRTRHPHGRIQAYPEIPPRVLRKLVQAGHYLELHGRCVLCDVVTREQADAVRIVGLNESFVAFVPFAGRLPYEVHVAPRRHAASLIDLTDPERLAFASMLELVFAAYDRVFGSDFSYVMAVHQAPTDDGLWQPVSHLQLEVSPLASLGKNALRSGPEWAAGVFEVDLRPEEAAAELRGALRP